VELEEPRLRIWIYAPGCRSRVDSGRIAAVEAWITGRNQGSSGVEPRRPPRSALAHRSRPFPFAVRGGIAADCSGPNAWRSCSPSHSSCAKRGDRFRFRIQQRQKRSERICVSVPNGRSCGLSRVCFSGPQPPPPPPLSRPSPASVAESSLRSHTSVGDFQQRRKKHTSESESSAQSGSHSLQNQN